MSALVLPKDSRVLYNRVEKVWINFGRPNREKKFKLGEKVSHAKSNILCF